MQINEIGIIMNETSFQIKSSYLLIVYVYTILKNACIFEKAIILN